jgi:hypothetical protein
MQRKYGENVTQIINQAAWTWNAAGQADAIQVSNNAMSYITQLLKFHDSPERSTL